MTFFHTMYHRIRSYLRRSPKASHAFRLRWIIPLFWQTLMRRYLEFFFVALMGIVAVLLTSRLEEVARFISVGASCSKIFLFILYQIPYILQIALPISGFIAGYSLSSRMSQAGELTACRSLGASITAIFSPVLLLSALLSFFTFLFVFDLGARCHLATKILENDVRAQEPLALLQSGQFLNQHSIALELSGSLKTGSQANDMLLCMMPKGQDRLTLALFVNATAEENALTGDMLSVFSTRAPKDASHEVGTSCVENAQQKKTPTHYVHELTQKKTWRVGADHLHLSTVLAMRSKLAKEIAKASYKGKVSKNTLKLYGRCRSEPWRRTSLSIAVSTLTLVGLLFGMYIGRSKSPFHFIRALIPFFCFIALYLMGKNIDEIAPLAIICYTLPHIILLAMAKWQKTRIEEGACN